MIMANDKNVRNQLKTRKLGNCECIATWGRPTPRQYISALITTSCQVWSHWTYLLPYYSVFAADTLLYAVTLTFGLWLLTFAVCCLWHDKTMYHWLNAVEQSTAELLHFQYLTLWPRTCVTCCALNFYGNSGVMLLNVV